MHESVVLHLKQKTKNKIRLFLLLIIIILVNMRITAAAIELIARQYVNAAYVGLGHNRPVDSRQFKSFSGFVPLVWHDSGTP